MVHSTICTRHQIYMYTTTDLLTDAAAVDRFVDIRRQQYNTKCTVYRKIQIIVDSISIIRTNIKQRLMMHWNPSVVMNENQVVGSDSHGPHPEL